MSRRYAARLSRDRRVDEVVRELSKKGWNLGRILSRCAIVVVLLVVFVPVLLKQLFPGSQREFQRVSLDETRFVEIEFRNSAQNLDLAGMLFTPDAAAPVPAAVVIHGSGTSRRNNGWYLTLTRFLRQHGIAVLLPDKRGSEKSGGDWRSSSFHDLATDTLAAIDVLKEYDAIDPARIGIIGMSQGGWIAPIVASESADVSFVVSIVGSAVTPIEQLTYEERHNLRQAGFLPGIAHAIAALSTRYIRNIKQRAFWDRIEGYDPIPYWQRVSVDSLVLYGSDDTNVPSAESARRLKAIGNPKIRIETFEGSGHALESPPGMGNSIMRHDALEQIAEFIVD